MPKHYIANYMRDLTVLSSSIFAVGDTASATDRTGVRRLFRCIYAGSPGPCGVAWEDIGPWTQKSASECIAAADEVRDASAWTTEEVP